MIRLNVALISRLRRHTHLGVPTANMGTNAREGAEVHSNLDAVLSEAMLGVWFPAGTFTTSTSNAISLNSMLFLAAYLIRHKFILIHTIFIYFVVFSESGRTSTCIYHEQRVSVRGL